MQAPPIAQGAPGVVSILSDEIVNPGMGGGFDIGSGGIPTHPDYGFGSNDQRPQGPQNIGPYWNNQAAGPYWNNTARGSAISSSDSSGSTATSYRADPTGPLPTYEAGTFTAPEYDTGAADPIQQRLAAPGLRHLREQISKVQAQTYENPNVKAMTVREALKGYGSGVEKVMASAYGRAMAEYNKRYEAERLGLLENFRAKERANQANFQRALTAWSKTGSATGSFDTTGTSGYTSAGGGSSYSTRKVPGTPSRGF